MCVSRKRRKKVLLPSNEEDDVDDMEEYGDEIQIPVVALTM